MIFKAEFEGVQQYFAPDGDFVKHCNAEQKRLGRLAVALRRSDGAGVQQVWQIVRAYGRMMLACSAALVLISDILGREENAKMQSKMLAALVQALARFFGQTACSTAHACHQIVCVGQECLDMALMDILSLLLTLDLSAKDVAALRNVFDQCRKAGNALSDLI